MPAPINSPASLPQKPATSNSRPQSSLRNIVKRSVSISDDEDQPTASTSTSTPVIKRGRYERKESSLVEKALKSISTQSPAVKPSSNKTQFEKQEDFISFDFE